MKIQLNQPYSVLSIGLLFSSFLISVVSVAQDTLNFRNGNTVIANVTEITPELVKYKKNQNMDGPSYSDFKNDIASIHYKNGTKELFEYQEPVQTIVMKEKQEDYFIAPKKHPSLKRFGATKFVYDGAIIGNHEFHSVLLNVGDKRITNHIRLAQQQEKGQYIGFAFFPCAIAGIIMASQSNSTNIDDERVAGAFMGVLGVACFATSITLKVKRNKNEEAALKLYQQNY